MKYEISKNKIDQSYNREIENENQIDKLKKIDLIAKPYHTNKKIITIPIIRGYNMTNNLGGEFSPIFERLDVGGGEG